MAMLKRFWCACFHMQVGESVYTDKKEYAGILWTCRDCKMKRIKVAWNFDDEFCPDGFWGKHHYEDT